MLTTLAIAIPVRNEVARLPRLLGALRDQQGASPFVLCLFFDNCTDGSEELVRAIGTQPYPIVTERCHDGRPPNAGAARGRATRIAAEAAGNGLVLTTDADSAPAADWVAANLAALGKADVVAGRIERRRPATDVQTRIGRYYDRLHRARRKIDPVAWECSVSHHWTSAASLGFSAALYRQLGGFSARPSGEDADLVDRACRAGYRVRRDAKVAVWTSDRRQGRALGGFATSLSDMDASLCLPQVAHPGDEAWRFHLHAAARKCHLDGSFDELALPLQLPLRKIQSVAAESPNGEAFAARIVGSPPGGMRQVSLARAEVILAGLESLHLQGAA